MDCEPWEKDPADDLDYKIDWSSWLSGDTITTSTWEKVGSVDIDSDTFTATDATVWLSSGDLGDTCEITNRIVTSVGRTAEQTRVLIVVDRKC